MKAMKYLSILFVALYISAIPSSSQKLWTLEECIKYALDNNIQIKRQSLQSEISRNDFRQSKYQVLPDLNAGASHNWNFGRNVDPFTNEITNTTVMTDNFFITSSITLFNGFQIRNTIEQNWYILEKSIQDFEQAKNDISLQVATAFLQILFNEEAVGIAESQLEVTSLQMDKTHRLVDAGSKAKGELLQIQAQEASEKYNLINAKNNLKVSYLTLAQLLEFRNGDSIKILLPDSIAPDFSAILITVDEIYKESIEKLPQIKSAEFQQIVAEKALLIAQGQRSPKLSLSGSYGTGYSDARERTEGLVPRADTIGYVNGAPGSPVIRQDNSLITGNYPFTSQLKDNQYKSLSFRLDIPLFNNLQTSKNIKNAKLRYLDATYNLEQIKKNLYKEIQNAYTDAIAAMERFKSATEAVTYNEESFKYSQQKFDVGVLSSVDYNVSKNNLTLAKSNLVQAKYDYLFKIKVLDFYRGNPLTLN